MSPDAAVAGFVRLVDVHALHGSPVGAWERAADSVVEDDDLLGAGDVFKDDGLDLGVVDVLDAVFVGEGGFGGGDVGDGLEGLFVEVEVGLEAAEVVDGDDLVVFGFVGGGDAGGGGFDVVVGGLAVDGGGVEGEGGGDVAADGVGGGFSGGSSGGSGGSAVGGGKVEGGGEGCDGRHFGGVKLLGLLIWFSILARY